jgi:hypothetical protein
VRLWKEIVNLETSSADERIILSSAVEVIPPSVKLWLALACLETPEKVKGVLNKACKAMPTSHKILIAAGRLIDQEVPRPPCSHSHNAYSPTAATFGAVRPWRRHTALTRASTNCLRLLSSAALRRKYYGLCGSRRSGWVATYMRRVRSSNAHS